MGERKREVLGSNIEPVKTSLSTSGNAMEWVWRDANLGLEAVMVVDDTTLGPPVGGTRTKVYPDFEYARRDARALARAMTLKCALSGLDAGGLKLVVRLPPQLTVAARQAIFVALGERLAQLEFEIHTAGDFGTGAEDLAAMAQHARCVHLGGSTLADATARGLLRCIEVCAARRGRDVASLAVAVQGCGAIGSAVAKALVRVGMRVVVADVDERRAQAIDGCEVVAAARLLQEPVDIVAPCAMGGVIDHAAAGSLRAWAVVGAANNILSERSVSRALRARGVTFVPDVIASAGAVIDGVGERVMGVADRAPMIDALGEVLSRVLSRADADNVTPLEAAERMAAERLATGAAQRGR